MNFRTLCANEIECRVNTVSEKGCSLLLYKDARVDMNLLDETVGSENWQRSHELINGNMFCNVSIKVGDAWVSKQDVGVESNTEKEKGQASDSFKRACVNWGIGRELYTAPFIWLGNDVAKIELKGNKYTTYDRFEVKNIAYDKDRNISGLTIVNSKTHKVVYRFPKGDVDDEPEDKPKAEAKPKKTKSDENPKVEVAEKPQDDAVTEAQARARVIAFANKTMSAEEITKLCEAYKITSLTEMPLNKCNHYINFISNQGKAI